MSASKTLTQPQISLNDGKAIPQLGFGVWQVADAEAPAVIGEAVAAGYRAIDTAAIYENEAGVGTAIQAALKSGAVKRDDLFITTKLWNNRHSTAVAAFGESLERLRIDQVDLYLIHWPVPKEGRFVEAWKALIRLREQGRARSIGVSNFNADHLQRLIDETGVVPAVNQIELHPRFQQKALRDFHAKHGIATESWSPLGQGKLLQDPAIAAIARKHGRTPAQIVIRWHLDQGLIAIPKSVTPARIRENIAVFDFRLDDADHAAIAKLDSRDGRIGPDPTTFG